MKLLVRENRNTVQVTLVVQQSYHSSLLAEYDPAHSPNRTTSSEKATPTQKMAHMILGIVDSQ